MSGGDQVCAASHIRERRADRLGRGHPATRENPTRANVQNPCCFLHGLTAGRVAKACGIARTRIERIAAEEIGISGDTAIRLGRFFRTTPQFWMNLQQHYELEKAAAALGEAIAAISPFEREAA